MLVLCLATLLCLALSQPLRAKDAVVVDGVADNSDDFGGRSGMPASNARVKPIIAAHPGQYVVICVAGCDGKPRAVQVLPRAVVRRAGKYVPSAAAAKKGKEVYGPPRPGSLAAAVAANDVVCLAGCIGREGQILQRISDLPKATGKPAKRTQKRKSPLEMGR